MTSQPAQPDHAPQAARNDLCGPAAGSSRSRGGTLKCRGFLDDLVLARHRDLSGVVRREAPR